MPSGNQQSIIMTGALTRLYINNAIYKVAQSVSLEIDTGEYEVRGINSPYPQELAGGGQISIRGSVKGVRVKQSGGVQGQNIRPLFSDAASSNLVSIRLEARDTGEVLWSVPKCKITKVSETTQVKGLYYISFDFIGMVNFWALDLS